MNCQLVMYKVKEMEEGMMECVDSLIVMFIAHKEIQWVQKSWGLRLSFGKVHRNVYVSVVVYKRMWTCLLCMPTMPLVLCCEALQQSPLYFLGTSRWFAMGVLVGWFLFGRVPSQSLLYF